MKMNDYFTDAYGATSPFDPCTLRRVIGSRYRCFRFEWKDKPNKKCTHVNKIILYNGHMSI